MLASKLNLALSVEECTLLLCLLEQTSWDHRDRLNDAAMEIKSLISGVTEKLIAATTPADLPASLNLHARAAMLEVVRARSGAPVARLG